uniref:H15 domain-containing protein n=1 Tax=Oryza punctata TaxID=4537 RepID=A0A0E0M0Z9_ORYPU
MATEEDASTMAAEEDPKPASATPSYPEMILAAIEALDDKNGSNKTAISQYIEENGMPRARGRPPKKAKVDQETTPNGAPAAAAAPSPAAAEAGAAPPVKRGRGRPPKVRPAAAAPVGEPAAA